MHIGVIRENDTENRVSIVPNSVKKLIKAGFGVSIETGAGDRSNHSIPNTKLWAPRLLIEMKLLNATFWFQLVFPTSKIYLTRASWYVSQTVQKSWPGQCMQR